MSKNNCCCGAPPSGLTFESFCCNPYLFTDFITLYGDSMADHAEVSPGDWIALKQTRLGAVSSSFWCSQGTYVDNICNCCDETCTGSQNQFQQSISETSKHKSGLDSLNIFDPFNENGTIIKNNKPKPNNKNNLTNNSFFKSKKYKINKIYTGPGNRYETLLNSSGVSSYSFFDEKVKQYGYAQNIQIGELQNEILPSQYVQPYTLPEILGLTFSYVYGNTVTANEAYEYSINNFTKEFIPTPNTNSLEFIAACDISNVDWGSSYDSFCRQNCNCGHIETKFKSDFAPIYFAYKYSGCNFIWHPREFLFDKDPFITQCSASETNATSECGAFPATVKAITNCGAFATTRIQQGWLTAGSWDCSEPLSGAVASSLNPTGSPCHCANFPHIHGGIRDALQGEYNVTQRPGQLGYVPSFRAFMPEMEQSELGCCWCAGSNSGNAGANKFNITFGKTLCRTKYPFAPFQGRNVRFFDFCGPGIGCYYKPETDESWAAKNPNYTTSCFQWGISPYLIRVAKDQFKAGHEIFTHGNSSDPFKKINFGGDFTLSSIEVDSFRRNIDIRLRKQPVFASTLKDQCIGFVQLEHHFECCAFKCPVGAVTNDPGTVVNSGFNMYSLYEMEAYPGTFKGIGGPTCSGAPGAKRATFNISQYGAHVWQIKRGVPRRVMYAGSGVPLFKFDLIMMENWSKENSQGQVFDATFFLESWYRYYYGLISFSAETECTQCNVPAEPLEWDYGIYENSYRYVTYWLDQMVFAGILRIKDHAIDIASEVNNLIGSAAYITDPDNPDQEILSVPQKTINECGGIPEFIKLVNFFGDTYPEVEPGTKNVTPKMVKQKLLNEAGLHSYSGPGTEAGSNQTKMRAFLPRRARLPSGSADTQIYGWGCTGDTPSAQLSGCTTCFGLSSNGVTCCLPEIECPSYVTAAAFQIPFILNTANDELLAEIAPIKVVSSLANTAIIDRNGKLSIFGGKTQNGDSSAPCGPLNGYDIDGRSIEYPCSFDMHPSALASIPWYLDLIWAVEATTIDDDTIYSLKSYQDLPDGVVKDVALNPNFGVALVDSYRKSLGSYCGSNTPQADFKPSFENPEWSPAYQAENTNGTNITIQFGEPQFPELRTCVLFEPWCTVIGGTYVVQDNGEGGFDPADNYFGARIPYSEGPKVDTFRLKSWGSKGKTLGTFSLALEDARIYNLGWGRAFIESCSNENIPFENLGKCTCAEFDSSNTATLADSFFNGYRGYDAEINPNNLRYPGTNTWFIWTQIACGLNHFAALDDFGGLFITAQSSNEDGQSTKGKPLPYFNVQNPQSWRQQGFSDPKFYYPDYCGFESRFNYYNHIPRPGFIRPEDWNQDLYNSLTSRFSPWMNCNGACSQTVIIDGTIGINACIRITENNRAGTYKCNDNEAISGPAITPNCYKRIRLPEDNCQPMFDKPRVWDLTTYLMGSYCQRSPAPRSEEANIPPADPIAACKPIFKVDQQPDNPFQPRYLKLAAGLFNTMLLTNENRVEVYGKYYQIDENGEKIGPKIKITDSFGNVTEQIRGITCFVPNEVLNLQGSWGLTYACPAYCPPVTHELDDGTIYEAIKGITHYPIIGAKFNYPEQKNIVDIIKSSADYSIASTKGGRIFVWGDASMVPGAYNQATYTPGTTASAEINLVELDNLPSSIPIESITIKDIAVGVHSFYIHYKINLANVTADFYRTVCYSRYGRKDFGAELPENIKNSELVSLSAGNGFAIAIAGGGSVPLTWNYNLFNDEHKKYQYKNYQNLPLYFRRDAYFHAVPGNWDFSKWLWGEQVCSSIQRFYPNHPALKEDFCASLAYNIYRDKEGNNLPSSVPTDSPLRFIQEKSYSGHPELLWNRPDLRRTIYQSFSPISDFRTQRDDAGGFVNVCTGYAGGAVPTINPTSSQSVDFGYCFERLGSCWSSAQPGSPLKGRRIKRRVDPCRYATIDCPKRDKPRICPDGPLEFDGLGWGYVCLGSEGTSTTSYAASKDIFQFKTVEWASESYASGDTCLKYGQYRLNYFKYSQRNFYLGYDPEKDTWDIYKSPDILRNTVKTTGTETDLCCGQALPGEECPSPNPDRWRCPGLTGIQTNGNCGWGGGISGSWPSLSTYPMVGPNYTRQDIAPIPIHIPKSKQIGLAFFWAGFGTVGEGNQQPCFINPCGGYGGNPITIFEGLGGPGVLAFRGDGLISCASIHPETGEVTPPTIPSGSSIYYHNPINIYFDTPSVMLSGVNNNINPNISPGVDPNYTTKGFLEVLRDPNLTNVNQPWIVGNDEETYILFESGFPGKIVINNHGQTAGNVIFFDAPPSDVDGTGNILKIQIETPGSSDIEYLKEQTAYYVSTKEFTENKFAICKDLNRLDRPINFTVLENSYGISGNISINSTKWYHMFDVNQSYFEGIFAEDGFKKIPPFVGGATFCYSGPNAPIPAGSKMVEVVLDNIDGQEVIDRIIGNPIGFNGCCSCD